MSSPPLGTMTAVESQLATAIAAGEIPGAVMCATSADGSFSYARALGVRKLANDQDQDQDGTPALPMQLDSMLRIASCTKLVTTIAVLQCVERGLIGLDDDVAPFLPRLAAQKVLVTRAEAEADGWKAPTAGCDGGEDDGIIRLKTGKDQDGNEVEEEYVLVERKGKITLRLMLTHSGGTQAGFFEPKLRAYRERAGTLHGFDRGTTVEARMLMPLGFHPGTSWAYGAGHDWAGKVAEAVTGQTLEELFAARIFGPLGHRRNATFWWRDDAEIAARVAQCSKRDITVSNNNNVDTTGASGGTITPMVPAPEWPPYRPTECMGGGGLVCSMPAFQAVLTSLLRNDGVLLRPETVDGEVFKPQLTPAARDALNAAMFQGGMKDAGPGETPPHVPLDWGLGAMITTRDNPGWRRAGTLTWGGLPNLFWFVDRAHGLAGVFGAQTLPTGDKRTKELTTLWEREMYRLTSKADQQ